MESEPKVEIEPKRVKHGRPRTVNIIDKKEYQTTYYEKNKDKTKGDALCPHCNLLYSKSNKTRHNRKYHPELVKEKTKTKILHELVQELNKMSLDSLENLKL